MPQSTARVHTPMAQRYLTQLCKHFEHKLAVTHGDGAGHIAFSIGECTLQANDNDLTISVSAADEPALAQVQDVVSRHLVRFAFREDLAVTWLPAA